MAELNVHQCAENHDKCRNTEKYRLAGQNLAILGKTDRFVQIPEAITEYMREFYAEKDDVASIDVNVCCGESVSPKKNIFHFTQMVNDKAIAVGCAFAAYHDSVIKPPDVYKMVLGACNYAFFNMVGQPIYTSGPVASQCTTGTNPKYPGLCAVGEPVNPNEILKLFGIDV